MKLEDKYAQLGRGQIARMAMKVQGAYVAEPSKEERLQKARAALRSVTEPVTQRADVTQSYVTQLERTVTGLQSTVTALRDEVARLQAENEALRKASPVSSVPQPIVAKAVSADPACQQCGKPIIGGTKRARFCGPSCRKTASRQKNSTGPGTEAATDSKIV